MYYEKLLVAKCVKDREYREKVFLEMNESIEEIKRRCIVNPRAL